jgi:hypothetical protein
MPALANVREAVGVTEAIVKAAKALLSDTTGWVPDSHSNFTSSPGLMVRNCGSNAKFLTLTVWLAATDTNCASNKEAAIQNLVKVFMA